MSNDAPMKLQDAIDTYAGRLSDPQKVAMLRRALTKIANQYENQDMGHVAFRVLAKTIADEALTATA